jgi:DNA mismatch endonuclease (patch repair protein)
MKHRSEKQISYNMSRIKSKDSVIEVTLRKALWKEGFRYRKNWKELPGKPDIVLTKQKVVVFCDSEFFHGKDWEQQKRRISKGRNPDYWIPKISRNLERDNQVDKELKAMGWSVIRFWGKDITNNLEECIRTVKETIFDKRMDSFEEE